MIVFCVYVYVQQHWYGAQGSKKKKNLSEHPGQVDFSVGLATFFVHVSPGKPSGNHVFKAMKKYLSHIGNQGV